MPNDTAEKQRKHRAQRRAKGLCYYCSTKVVDGVVCRAHLISGRERNIKRHIDWERDNRCKECGIPLDEDADAGRKCCIACREHIIKPTLKNIRRGHATISS